MLITYIGSINTIIRLLVKITDVCGFIIICKIQFSCYVSKNFRTISRTFELPCIPGGWLINY